MAWYDLDNSGGFGLGDITTGLGNVGDYLFGSSGDSATYDNNLGVMNDSIQSLSSGGASDSYINNFANNFYDSNLSKYLPSSGLLGDVSGYLNTGLDWLGNNKDSINAVSGLLGAYGQYETSQAMQDYYDSLIAQANAETARRDEATASMQEGFSSSGLFDTVKKPTTNYYNV